MLATTPFRHAVALGYDWALVQTTGLEAPASSRRSSAYRNCAMFKGTLQLFNGPCKQHTRDRTLEERERAHIHADCDHPPLANIPYVKSLLHPARCQGFGAPTREDFITGDSTIALVMPVRASRSAAESAAASSYVVRCTPRTGECHQSSLRPTVRA